MNVKYFKPQGVNGPYVDVDGRLNTKGHEHIRPSIGALAFDNNQALEVNMETNRVRRVPIDQYDILQTISSTEGHFYLSKIFEKILAVFCSSDLMFN